MRCILKRFLTISVLTTLGLAQIPYDYCPSGSDLFINAGGVNLPGTNYRCDTGAFVTSQTSWTWSPPMTSTLSGSCTEQYLSHRSAGNNLVFDIPTPQGTYNIALLFAETYFDEPGKRLFSLSINGELVEDQAIVNGLLDVYKAAKGKNKPLNINVPGVLTSGGIKIELGKNIENPMISAIGIQGSGANSYVGNAYIGSCEEGAIPPPVADAPVDVCPTNGDAFINCGDSYLGNGYRCDDGSYVASSSTWSYKTPKDIVLSGSCTEHYLSHRSGELTYNVPVPAAGSYTVLLMFLEVWWEEAGKRKFKVSVQGNYIQPNGVDNVIDVYQLKGTSPLVVAVNSVEAKNGFISISLEKVAGAGDPMISGIGIKNADGIVGKKGLNACGDGAVVPPPPKEDDPLPEDDTDVCPILSDVFINCGGKNLDSGFRCDSGAYSSPGSSTFEVSEVSQAIAGDCTEQYLSHRYAAGSTEELKYSIPVPQGKSYTVILMFLEVWWKEAGKRKFKVSVQGNYIQPNGVNNVVDVYQLKGTSPLVVAVKSVQPTNGFISVTLERIAGAGDPMISGIGIKNANGIVGNNWLDSCEDDEIEPPPPKEDAPIIKTDICPGLSDVFINAGGKNLDNGFRCDSGAYASPGSSVYEVPEANVGLTGDCTKHYLSHRYASSSFEYNIPVPSGKTYHVYLMFMENYFQEPGKRLFTVSVNGKPVVDGSLDVYEKAGGLYKPLLLSTRVIANSGMITVQLGKVVENAMISGIGIAGIDVSLTVGTAFLESCQTLPSPVPCPENGGSFSDSSDPGHVAHAVSGGPYVETDFDKDGKAKVQIDGLGSHSHASFPGNGVITTYTWTWHDPENPSADANGKVSIVEPTPVPVFPSGTTELTLTVADQFCNKASEKTTVTINPATKEGAYCYYYDFMDSAPKTVPISFSEPETKPEYAQAVGSINFDSTNSFGTFPFSDKSFAVRCVFSIQVNAPGNIQYQITHNGPIKAYSDDELVAESDGSNPDLSDTVLRTRVPDRSAVTTTKNKFFAAGTHQWQLLYFNQHLTPAELKFQSTNGQVISSDVVRHDASTTLPVITSLSKTTAFANEIVNIYGSAFVNGVTIRFGKAIAEPIISKAGNIQIRVPLQENNEQVVEVVVETLAGSSNGIVFTYGSATEKCQVISFEKASLKNQNNQEYEISDIAVLKYGPDGRLYLGSTKSMLHVLALNKDLKVTERCDKAVVDTSSQPNRMVLGIAFNPKSIALKMYFSTSTMYWFHNNGQVGLPMSFGPGWQNGKVQSITLNGPSACFSDDITDVVTGLPVSDHDHGVNFLQFLPDGRLIIAVGGFTNGGISVPNDGLGGIPAPPYAGAIVECPYDGSAKIAYSDSGNPGSTMVTGGGCTVFAAGLRNTFSGELHTNGALYATDNGPNQGFGAFSTDCQGGQVPDQNLGDKLIEVVEGDCHGHPHLLRGMEDPRQCVFNSNACQLPLLDNLPSSTNGVLEYRSNFFSGSLKGNLFLTKYSLGPGKKGSVTRVQLDEAGGITNNGVTQLFEDDSGLSVVEGPRGELIMSRVYKSSFLVYKPTCKDNFDLTYLIGVHPRRGPATGGHKVLIAGFNFGDFPVAMFGSQPCTEVTKLDADSFTCLTPAGVAGTQVKVVVEGATGENLKTAGSDYWYW